MIKGGDDIIDGGESAFKLILRLILIFLHSFLLIKSAAAECMLCMLKANERERERDGGESSWRSEEKVF